jgi:hypothetical protein
VGNELRTLCQRALCSPWCGPKVHPNLGGRFGSPAVSGSGRAARVCATNFRAPRVRRRPRLAHARYALPAHATLVRLHAGYRRAPKCVACFRTHRRHRDPSPGKVKLPTRACAHTTGKTSRTISLASCGFANGMPKIVAGGFRYRVRSTIEMLEDLRLALLGS